MGDLIDTTAPPRPGEELDTTGLRAWLTAHVPELPETEIEVAQFPSGHSNLTYLLRLGDREVVLRRPPFGAQARGGHDMSREHAVLARIHAAYPPAPRPIAFCDDHSVMGVDFYLMERIRGIIIRQEVPADLDLGPAVMGRLCESFVDNLATIHTLDWEGAGLGDLSKGLGYVERQIRGWTARWEAAKTDEIPQMDEIAGWLARNMPPDRGQALIHNDFKFDNIVLDAADPTRVIGVLDWEMATIGDPIMDLGTTLGYWVEVDDPAGLQLGKFGPTTLPGSMTRAAIVERYHARTGYDVTGIGYYYTYAVWKLAVVLQQIYFRYAQGYTGDERFAGMIEIVRMLAGVAADSIDAG